MFQISKSRILVQVNKAAQKQKRERKGSIYLHPSFVFMDRNLQHGRVCQIGDKAKQNYPYIDHGDLIFFHHTIEDGSDRLIDQMPDGDDLLWLDASDLNLNYEIYGVMKAETGQLVTSQHHIWLSPDITPLRKVIKSDNIIISDGTGPGEDDDDFLRNKIAQLEMEKDLLKPGLKAARPGYTMDQEYDRRVEIINAINKKDDERKYLTSKLNQRKVAIAHVVAINGYMQSKYALKPGSRLLVNLPLYPLDIYNAANPEQSRQFYIVRSTEVLAEVS